MIRNISASMPLSKFQKLLRESIAAVISFDAVASFPLAGGVVFSIVPQDASTVGATFVGFSEPQPGLLKVDYKLTAPLPQADRAPLTSAILKAIISDPLQPFSVLLDVPGDDDFSQIVVANGSPQAPGSPDVVLEFHTLIIDVPGLGA